MTEHEAIVQLIRRWNLYLGHEPECRYWAILTTEDDNEEKLKGFKSIFGGDVYLNDRTKLLMGKYKWYVTDGDVVVICKLLVLRPAFKMLTPKYAIAKQIIQYAEMLGCA